jgi:hypothetical protein
MNRLLLIRLARLLYAPAGHGRLFRLAHHPPPLPRFQFPFRPVVELLGLLFICGLMLTPAIILALGGAVLVMIFNGTIFGAWWANQMTALLTGLHGRGVYAQYAVLPGGRLSLHLAISTGILHRLESLHNLHRVVRSTAAVIGGFTLFSLCMIGLNAQGWRAGPDMQSAMQTSLNTSFGLLTFLLLYYIDHIASIILCALCGMLVPMWTTQGTEARVWAIGLFLCVQVASYAVWALLALGLLPRIIPPAPGGLERIVVLALQVLLYLVIREGVIRLIWRVFTTDLELAANEINSL